MSPLWDDRNHGGMGGIRLKLSSLVRRSGSGKRHDDAKTTLSAPLGTGPTSAPAPAKEYASSTAPSCLWHFRASHDTSRNVEKQQKQQQRASWTPLDVDIKTLESYRLGSGWLEDLSDEDDKRPPTPPPKDNNNSHSRSPGRPSVTASSSKTPIAEMFSMSTDALNSAMQTITRKPVPPRTGDDHLDDEGMSVLLRPRPLSTHNLLSEMAPPTAPADEPERERGRSTTPAARPPSSAPWNQRPGTGATMAAQQGPPQPIRISLRDSSVGAEAMPSPTADPRPRRGTFRASWTPGEPLASIGPEHMSNAKSSSAAAGMPQRSHSVRQQVNLLRGVGTNTTGLRVSADGGGGAVTPTTIEVLEANSYAKRHSLRSEPPTPTGLSIPMMEEIKRRSWQAGPTSHPMQSPGSMGPPPLPGAGQRSASGGSDSGRRSSSRPPSTALTSNRLAWIRELESKKSSASSSSDVKKLSGGGVAGKLAMFEQKASAADRNGAVRPPQSFPLSRSNSTTSRASRMSWSVANAGMEGPATTRTSIDSTRSGTGGNVMAYYDESFRERMEVLIKKQEEAVEGPRKETEKKEKSLEPKKIAEAAEQVVAAKAGAEPVTAEVAAEKAEVPAQVEAEKPAETLPADNKEEEPAPVAQAPATEETVKEPEPATEEKAAEVAVEATPVEEPSSSEDPDSSIITLVEDANPTTTTTDEKTITIPAPAPAEAVEDDHTIARIVEDEVAKIVDQAQAAVGEVWEE